MRSIFLKGEKMATDEVTFQTVIKGVPQGFGSTQVTAHSEQEASYVLSRYIATQTKKIMAVVKE
jgi:hypothetical protein